MFYLILISKKEKAKSQTGRPPTRPGWAQGWVGTRSSQPCSRPRLGPRLGTDPSQPVFGPAQAGARPGCTATVKRRRTATVERRREGEGQREKTKSDAVLTLACGRGWRRRGVDGGDENRASARRPWLGKSWMNASAPVTPDRFRRWGGREEDAADLPVRFDSCRAAPDGGNARRRAAVRGGAREEEDLLRSGKIGEEWEGEREGSRWRRWRPP